MLCANGHLSGSQLSDTFALSASALNRGDLSLVFGDLPLWPLCYLAKSGGRREAPIQLSMELRAVINHVSGELE